MKLTFLIVSLIVILLVFLFMWLIYCEQNEWFKPSTKKIAFMFLIYDEINQEELWKKFFKKADRKKYNIYIHYKNKKYSNFFDKFKLQETIPTKWGDKSLVLAHNMLLREALKDKDNQHFVLLSGSCVPLKSFDYIYKNLDENYSYYGMIDEWNKTERNSFAELFIPEKYICKAHQWSILNRKHASLLADKNNENEYIHWFPIVPDEHAHITYLYYKDLQNELKETRSDDKNTMYTYWMSHTDNSPQEYMSISNEDVKKLVALPCLFGRKFNKNCSLLELEKLIGL